MWVEHCQERSFMLKMYLKKCLQSIGLCVHCCSGQFVCYLLPPSWAYGALWWWPCSSCLDPDIPLLLHLVSSGMSLKRPMALAQLAPWWFHLLSSNPVPCLLPPLTRLAPSFWHVLLAWLWGPPWCCRLPSNCQVCQMSLGIVSSNPPRSCVTLSMVHGRCLVHAFVIWLVDEVGVL